MDIETRKKLHKPFVYTGFASVGIMIVILLTVAIRYGIETENTMYATNEAIDTLGLFVVSIIMYSSVRNMRVNSSLDHAQIWYYRVLWVVAFGLFSDYFSWRTQGYAQWWMINQLANMVYFLCGPVSIFYYWKYSESVIGKQSDPWDKWINPIQIGTVAIGSIAVLMNNVFGFYFTVGLDGVYERTEGTFYLSLVPIVVISLLTILFIVRSKLNWKQKAFLISFELSPVLASLIQTAFFGVNVLYVVALCSTLHIYVNIQALREMEISQLRMKVIQSQLQPHFFYNTMISIRALIKRSPEKAVEAMDHFIGYLRGSVDMFDIENLIPIEQELSFVQDYLEIERIRFGENIQYTIQNEIADSFMIPPLAIQPMVENAIRHGIRKRESGAGNVFIRLYDENHNHIIEIADDGVGFDTNAPLGTERSHIGLSNTAKRLDFMMDGRMEVESTIGEGTKIRMLIPTRHD